MDHNALRRFRHARGLSQKQVAALIGVDPSYVAALESGDEDTPSPVLEREFARALGVARGQLFPVDVRSRETFSLDHGVAQVRRREPRR